MAPPKYALGHKAGAVSIPNDVKLLAGILIFKIKSTNLGFRWIGSQVIDLIVLFQLVECIA